MQRMMGAIGLVTLTLTASLSFAVGCEEDRAAVEALKQRTDRLAETVDERNDKLETLASSLESCRRDLGEIEDGGAVERVGDPQIEPPKLVGEETIAVLEKLEEALSSTIADQKDKVSELTQANDDCRRELSDARKARDAEHQAAAEAERERAAAGAERQRKERDQSQGDDEDVRPEAVQKREAEGKPSEGVRSRYRSREQ